MWSSSQDASQPSEVPITHDLRQWPPGRMPSHRPLQPLLLLLCQLLFLCDPFFFSIQDPVPVHHLVAPALSVSSPFTYLDVPSVAAIFA